MASLCDPYEEPPKSFMDVGINTELIGMGQGKFTCRSCMSIQIEDHFKEMVDVAVQCTLEIEATAKTLVPMKLECPDDGKTLGFMHLLSNQRHSFASEKILPKDNLYRESGTSPQCNQNWDTMSPLSSNHVPTVGSTSPHSIQGEEIYSLVCDRIFQGATIEEKEGKVSQSGGHLISRTLTPTKSQPPDDERRSTSTLDLAHSHSQQVNAFISEGRFLEDHIMDTTTSQHNCDWDIRTSRTIKSEPGDNRKALSPIGVIPFSHKPVGPTRLSTQYSQADVSENTIFRSVHQTPAVSIEIQPQSEQASNCVSHGILLPLFRAMSIQ